MPDDIEAADGEAAEGADGGASGGVEPEPFFDASTAAAEYEAENGNKPLDEETGLPKEESQPVVEKPGAAPKAAEPQVDDDPDDVKFLESSKGKAIPYEAFVKKNEKWKKRNAEALQKAQKLEEEFNGYKKTQPLAPEQVSRYQNLDKVFGNLDKAAIKYPWLREALMDIGKGKDPDFRVLHQALDGHIKALPTADPIVIRRLEAMEEQSRKIGEAEFNRGLQAHLQSENSAIEKFFNGNPDEELKNVVNDFAMQMVPETGDLSNLPKRTEMAEKLLKWADKRAEAKVQEALKKMVPAKPVRQASINAGKGAAAAAAENDDPPPFGTEEYREWLARGVVRA